MLLLSTLMLSLELVCRPAAHSPLPPTAHYAEAGEAWLDYLKAVDRDRLPLALTGARWLPMG
jgi:hypothetical protein